MATSKADEYLAKALECEKRAEQTGDNFIKQRLIEIAQSGGPWPLTGRAQRFKNLSGGIVMVISRGFGSNKVESENMAP